MEVIPLNNQAFLAGGGEMGELIRSMNWDNSPLGALSQWPQSLRTALSIVLANRVAMSIAWGPSLINLYNDAYRPILGATKHPRAMGNSLAGTFPEAWEQFEPVYRKVQEGQALGLNDVLVELDRNGYIEECYFDISYSPVRDETGGVGGVLGTVTEITGKHIAERRLRTLRDMAARAAGVHSLQDARDSMVLTIEENAWDIPFALYYTLHGSTATLAGAVRINEAEPSEISLQDNDAVWPLAQCAQTGQPVLVASLNGMPGGHWTDSATSACIMPVILPGNTSPYGFFILGINPRKAFDDSCRDFFSLLTGHFATAIANAIMLTTQENTLRRIQEERQRFYNLLIQAPIPILILRKPNFLVELVNESYVNIINLKVDDLAGRPIFDVLPELQGQGYEQLINQVIATGEPFVGNSLPIKLVRNGREETAWFNFVYHPLREPDGIISGVMMTGTEVTDMVLAQKKMEQSEAYFRRVADNLPVMAWMTGADGKCIYLNQRWYEYTGQAPDSGLGINWLNAIHPDDIEQTKTIFFISNEKQQPFSMEYRLRGANGMYRWMLDSGEPIFDEQEIFEGFIGSVIDIDQRKLSENAVRESEMRFRQLADSMPQIVWTANPDGFTDYYNKQWYMMVGSEFELGDDSFIKHLHPEDRMRCLEQWYQSIRTGQTYEMEYRFRVKPQHGDYRWFLARANPIRDSRGEIIKWYGTSTDIDEVKNIEHTIRQELEKRVAERTGELSRKNEELRRSEERYLRMTNEVEDYAIVLLNRDGVIENWNRGAEKIKGYSAEEIIGQHIRIFYTPEDRENKVPESLIQVAVKQGKASFEGWRVRKDGSRFWAYAVFTALHDDKNDIIGFSKVTRDLTERKMAEDKLKMYAEQLEQKNKELERSNSELSAFSYVASHDLQEPLRKIQSFGNLIQARDANTLSDISRDYFDRMVKAAIRMQHLIDSLLEFSRTATGTKNFEEVDLNHILDEVKKELADRIEEKNGQVQSGKLPVCKVIPFQFRQLLFNLINNSLKYAKDDVPPLVQVIADYLKARDIRDQDALPNRDYYRFSVIDNGIGFEQEYAEKIFELFQRLHGRSEYSGSGIGLAICKKIMENHHGFIRAESEPGRGATFYFYLPVT